VTLRSHRLGLNLVSGLRALGELPAERRFVEVVDEGALAVDLDDWEPLAVGVLEGRLAGDVDLGELEPELGLEPRQLCPRPLAERALLRVEDPD